MSIYEIERKFLLKNDSWKSLVKSKQDIEQYYIDLSKISFHFKKNKLIIKANTFKIKLKLKPTEIVALKTNLHKEKKAVRIRSKNGNQYILTIKIDVGVVGKNIEVERFIEKEKYNWAKTITNSGISKVRNIVMFDGYKFEIDIFRENNEGKELAEVEVEDITYPKTLPEWIGEEVTGNPAYFNEVLSKN